MLLKYYLADSETISSSFIVSESDVLNKIVRKYTGQKLFNTSINKGYKVKKISALLGNK